MKSGVKYITAVLCCAAAIVFSLSLPVVYGKRVDSVTFDSVTQLEAEESIGTLAYKDNSDRISGILDSTERVRELGVTATPVYSVEADEMSEELKTNIVEQITTLCSSGIIPDLTMYDIYNDISYSEYYNLYTAENTLSLMYMFINGDDYSGVFLTDPETYCIYCCEIALWSSNAEMPALSDDYFDSVAEYYAADELSVYYFDSMNNAAYFELKFGENSSTFEVYYEDDFFFCGISSIYLTVDDYRDYVLSYDEPIYDSSAVY
ncbi:MAG: hypothetical protein LUE88_06570 [Clostridiales bacterium]|nr:hypothetical protein [Clostridiales bacterium]